MSERQTVRLVGAMPRRTAQAYIWAAPDGYVVTIQPPTRSLEANRKMWATLGDIARQVVWHGRKLAPEDWKIVFSASLRKLEVVPNLDGTGFVALGLHTSTMSVRQMSDLIELAQSFGAEHGVVWSDQAEELPC